MQSPPSPRYKNMLDSDEHGGTWWVDKLGDKHTKSRRYGTISFRCADARIESRFHVAVFHLRSGKGDMSIPGSNKPGRDRFKLKTLASVFHSIYSDDQTLAAHDVNVLVGDFNMEADLVTEAVQIFPLGADVTVHVWCPSGIRGDKLGRAGAPRLTSACHGRHRARQRLVPGSGT